MQSQVTRVPEGLIEYTIAGSGPTVVVCHGTSSNCFATAGSEPLVAAGFQVLVPSRPGYGRTPLETGPTAAEAARAIISLLDDQHIATCAVMAISGGGPTGVALAAGYPERVTRLILAAVSTRPEDRPSEPSYKNQMAFYGPMHNLTWGMLGLMSRLSPRSMARQTLAVFSTHDPDDGLSRLSPADVDTISRFYRGRSSRRGALNDAKHTVGAELLKAIHQPTLVVHSREDNSVPFAHAEWSLQHISQAELCEGGFAGHFFWIGEDFGRVSRKMVEFLRAAEPVAVVP